MYTQTLIGVVLAVLLCGLAPLAAGVVVGRRLRLPLRMFLIAAGFYLLNLLAQLPVLAFLGARVVHDAFLNGALVAPAVYAVFEETARYLSWRAGRSMRDHRTSDGAVLAGLGHGGMESIVFTLREAAFGLAAVLAPSLLLGGYAKVVLAGGLASYVVFVVGRVFAMACHVGFAHISMLSYRRSTWFLPVAMVVHFGVDASVFTVMGKLGNANPMWAVLFGLWAVLALALVVVIRRGRPSGVRQAAPEPSQHGAH